MPFLINPGPFYNKKVRKLVKKNPLLLPKITETSIKISLNPKDTSLNSHKVNSLKFGECFSSSVTGDIRILW